MFEQVFAQALANQPFTIIAMALAIIALWSSFKRAQSSRVAALEKGLKKCELKHEKCELRNQKLILAVVDAAEGRREDAMNRCYELMKPEPEEDEGQ